MRALLRSAAAGVLCAMAAAPFAFAATPADAMTGEPGGTAAPVSQAGGSQFGVPADVVRPYLSALTVPSTATAGRPPRIVLALSESHVATVHLRVLLIDLSSHATAVTSNMGWVHTSRKIAVVWPSGARLGPGTYRVTISAHDHRNGNILRNAKISGESTLTVQAAVTPVTPAPVTGGEGAASGAPTPAQTVADGAVFPVRGSHNFGGPENRFGAPREGHIHQGQDILTTEGTPDVAPLAGTIESTANQPGGAGYYVVEHTPIGFDFMFAHCEAGSFAVAAGQAVAAGAQLCSAGQTGDATTPHLHFEMWVGGWQAKGGYPIDPLPYLEAWEAAGH